MQKRSLGLWQVQLIPTGLHRERQIQGNLCSTWGLCLTLTTVISVSFLAHQIQTQTGSYACVWNDNFMHYSSCRNGITWPPTQFGEFSHACHLFLFVCLSFPPPPRRSCKSSISLDCYPRHFAEQYAKAPTYWVSANFKARIDYVPISLQLWALDPAPKSLLTFSGIYDVRMDFYHCLSSWHKPRSFYGMVLDFFMLSMNMEISVFLLSLPFLLLRCWVNGGRWLCLIVFISLPENI